MNNNLNNPILQGLLRPSSSLTAPRRVSRPPINQARQTDEVKEYYFSLAIYKADALVAHQRIEILEAKQRYKIVIQCDENPSQPPQQRIKIGPRQGFTLSLSWIPKTGILPFTFPLEEMPLSFSGPLVHPSVGYFTMPEECSSCELTVIVSYLKQGDINPIANVTQVTLPVQGTYTPEDPAWLKTYFLDTGLPPSTVALVAEREGDTKRCLITAYNYHRGYLPMQVLNTASLLHIGKALEERSLSAEEVLGQLRLFSRDNTGKLLFWLKSLYERIGIRFSILIFDTTDLEIPWELLNMKNGQYLGAVARIGRWLPMEPFGEKNPLKIVDVTYEGSVISYLDPQLPGVELERELFRPFVCESIATLDRLKARLRHVGSLLDIGLVYIGSHGNRGTHLYPTINPPHATTGIDDLTALSLAWIDEHPEPRPLFFINACESARILYKDEQQNTIYNLVKNILLPCGSSYIGTLANINSNHAAAIADHLLKLTRKSAGVQITELLRQLRSELWQALQDLYQQEALPDECEEMRKLLLSSFLYVYYGNPLARLHLRTIEPPTSEEQL